MLNFLEDDANEQHHRYQCHHHGRRATDAAVCATPSSDHPRLASSHQSSQRQGYCPHGSCGQAHGRGCSVVGNEGYLLYPPAAHSMTALSARPCQRVSPPFREPPASKFVPHTEARMCFAPCMRLRARNGVRQDACAGVKRCVRYLRRSPTFRARKGRGWTAERQADGRK